MAKLEELSELLVSEIRDFEITVKKLEEIQKKKISIDLDELKSVLANHETVLINQNLKVQETYNKFLGLLKEAKIYPKWAVIVFLVSLTLNLILISMMIMKSGS